MVEIKIQIDRPWMTLTIVGAIAGSLLYWSSLSSVPTQASVIPTILPTIIPVTQPPEVITQSGAPVGGSGDNPTMVVHQAEDQVYQMRLKQAVLSKKEQILRDDIAMLEKSSLSLDTQGQEQLHESKRKLVALLTDEHAAEQAILESLQEIWDAQGYAIQASQQSDRTALAPKFVWPIEPLLGISAHFEDAGYTQRFGIPHHAIDIPTPQGSVVAAAADGIVTKVSDKGMGFNSIVIQHDGGLATLYGHVTKFLVSEGTRVHAGDPIALSGGTPGTPGAGNLTTGAHLHLQFILNGAPVDPLNYLPANQYVSQ